MITRNAWQSEDVQWGARHALINNPSRSASNNMIHINCMKPITRQTQGKRHKIQKTQLYYATGIDTDLTSVNP